MKPVVHEDICIGDGTCEEDCPEVFQMQEDGLAHVINENPDPVFFDAVNQAAEDCPVEAITIEE